ncbi:22127_t:CDS:1 [Entrophospora sp. SA101]|nr:22127_t:CDS:1 [Entrophospora sp. SA101]
MSASALYENIYNFLLESPSDHITAFSVIFQVIDDDTWYPKDVLREIIRRATTKVRKFNDQNSEKYRRLIEIPSKVSYQYITSQIDYRVLVPNDDCADNILKTQIKGHP